MAEITIDKRVCKGCDICLSVCPKRIFTHSKKRNTYGSNMPEIQNPEKCALCGMCERMCPDGAIDVTGEKGKRNEN